MDGLPENVKLTPTSYIVLGLLARAGEATPYQLKTVVASSIAGFWTVQHAQLYAEPQRLARAGLVSERQEEGGRRRRTYALTDAGREALERWLAEPTEAIGEIRQPGLLQLFLGAEPGPLAQAQRAAHAERLAQYEALHETTGAHMEDGMRLALEAGMALEREWVRYWAVLEEAG